MKSEIWAFFESLPREFKLNWNLTKITGCITWRHMYIYDHISAEFFLEWELCKTVVAEKIKTRILRSVYFSPENRAVYEIMSKNMVQQDRPRIIYVWHTQRLHAHTEYMKYTATLVTRTGLIRTFIRTWPVLFRSASHSIVGM
jgi:hypothetical protein